MPRDFGAGHDFGKSREKLNGKPLWGKNSCVPDPMEINSGRSNISEKGEKKDYGKPISLRADKEFLTELEFFREKYRSLYPDEKWDSNGKVIKEIVNSSYERIKNINRVNEEQKKGSST